MTMMNDPGADLAPVHADEKHRRPSAWTEWLILFLRVMAAFSMIKGLYHWSVVCGFGMARDSGFEAQALPWQVATVFFAVIDLVAAVGLWLAAPWGAVVWLTGSVSMIVVLLFFPQIYGQQIAVMVLEALLIVSYLIFAIQAAREQPQ